MPAATGTSHGDCDLQVHHLQLLLCLLWLLKVLQLLLWQLLLWQLLLWLQWLLKVLQLLLWQLLLWQLLLWLQQLAPQVKVVHPWLCSCVAKVVSQQQTFVVLQA